MTNHTEFNNKISQPKLNDVIKLLQDKFGNKIPMFVSINSDGSIKKIEIEKALTFAEKKFVTDKFPELE